VNDTGSWEPLVIIILIIIIILPHIFVRSISRRCLDQTLWKFVGISYAIWSCVGKGWFFQNGCRCHGNGQNVKKLKNTKMIIAGYSPNRNWLNLIGTTSTSSGMR
jgi:multidrug transporter EmrE-like cation transporter